MSFAKKISDPYFKLIIEKLGTPEESSLFKQISNGSNSISSAQFKLFAAEIWKAKDDFGFNFAEFEGSGSKAACIEYFMFKYDKNNDKEIDKEEFDTFLQDLKDNIGRDAAGEFVPKIPFAVLALDNLPDGKNSVADTKGKVFAVTRINKKQGWYVNLDLGHTIKDIHDALAAAKKNNTNSANPNETELVGKSIWVSPFLLSEIPSKSFTDGKTFTFCFDLLLTGTQLAGNIASMLSNANPNLVPVSVALQILSVGLLQFQKYFKSTELANELKEIYDFSKPTVIQIESCLESLKERPEALQTILRPFTAVKNDMLDVVKLVQQVKRESFTSKLKNYFTADSMLEDMRKLKKKLKDHWKICSHAIQSVHFGLTISIASSSGSLSLPSSLNSSSSSISSGQLKKTGSVTGLDDTEFSAQLGEAIRENRLNTVLYLMDHPKINSYINLPCSETDNKGEVKLRAPIALAMNLARTEIVLNLLCNDHILLGPSPFTGSTPLHGACYNNRPDNDTTDCIILCLVCGISLDIKNKFQLTAEDEAKSIPDSESKRKMLQVFQAWRQVNGDIARFEAYYPIVKRLKNAQQSKERGFPFGQKGGLQQALSRPLTANNSNSNSPVWAWTGENGALENYTNDVQPRIEAAYQAQSAYLDINDTYRIEFGNPHYQTNVKTRNRRIVVRTSNEKPTTTSTFVWKCRMDNGDWVEYQETHDIERAYNARQSEFVLKQGYFQSTSFQGRIVFSEMVQKVVYYNQPTQVATRTVARVESNGKPIPKAVWFVLMDDGLQQEYVESALIEAAYASKASDYILRQGYFATSPYDSRVIFAEMRQRVKYSENDFRFRRVFRVEQK